MNKKEYNAGIKRLNIQIKTAEDNKELEELYILKHNWKELKGGLKE